MMCKPLAIAFVLFVSMASAGPIAFSGSGTFTGSLQTSYEAFRVSAGGGDGLNWAGFSYDGYPTGQHWFPGTTSIAGNSSTFTLFNHGTGTASVNGFWSDSFVFALGGGGGYLTLYPRDCYYFCNPLTGVSVVAYVLVTSYSVNYDSSQRPLSYSGTFIIHSTPEASTSVLVIAGTGLILLLRKSRAFRRY
jgi:hypothetical protein